MSKEQEDTTRMTDLGPENMAALGQFLEEALPLETNFMVVAAPMSEPAEEVEMAYVSNTTPEYAAEVLDRVTDGLIDAIHQESDEESEPPITYAG